MPLSDQVSIVSLLIAVLAAGFSIYSYIDTQSLAKKGFNRNFRPYLSTSTFAYINNQDGKYYTDMNVIMFILVNAPALITQRKLSFFIRENENDKLLFDHPAYPQILLYTDSRQQLTLTTDRKIINHEFAISISPKKLIQKVYIQYTWISKSKDVYYFQSESEYDVFSKDWKNISQSAS